MRAYIEGFILLVLAILIVTIFGCTKHHNTLVQAPAAQCTTTEDLGGYLITCTDGLELYLPRPVDGEDGLDGQDAVIEVIDPCGKQANNDEVLLRLSDGKLYAYFEQGSHRFLAEITPGNYQTTDGTNCKFRVSNDLQVIEL